jgi:hypothetical protein
VISSFEYIATDPRCDLPHLALTEFRLSAKRIAQRAERLHRAGDVVQDIDRNGKFGFLRQQASDNFAERCRLLLEAAPQSFGAVLLPRVGKIGEELFAELIAASGLTATAFIALQKLARLLIAAIVNSSVTHAPQRTALVSGSKAWFQGFRSFSNSRMTTTRARAFTPITAGFSNHLKPCNPDL